MKFEWVKPDPLNPADQGVNWSFGDFVVMGLLIFGAASLFVYVARRIPKKNRLVVGILFLLAFLLVWAQLAVGLIDNVLFAGS